MTSDNRGLARLTMFLNVYGVVSVILFGALFVMAAIDAPVMQEGGALRFLRWDPWPNTSS